MIACPKCGTDYDGAEMFCPKDGTRLGGSGEGRAVKPSIPPDADPLVGSVIQGRYKVLHQIGEGGMGVVYVAEHVEIEKKVALKVLRDDFSKRPEVVERFRQEARSASKIGHAHIVDVTDFGQLDDGGVYFVMEYLQGQGLSDLIRKQSITLERAVPIVTQIARALQAAHKLGIVHRDMKPENVFLVRREEEEDFVKILDFGIAKISDRDNEGKRLTKTGMIFGTPEYMSPEQAAGKALDHRVDVYALGCIMFEMFTGKVPFDGDSFMAVLTQHMFEPVPPIEELNPETDIPESVRNVVYKAMAKEPDERYPDMAAIETDLQRALGDAGYVVELPKREGSVRRSIERRDMSAGGDPTGSQSTGAPGTAMDWTPPSSSFQQEKKKGGFGIIIGVVAAILVIGGGAAAYFLGLIGPPRGGQDVAAASVPAPVATPASLAVPAAPKEVKATAAVEEPKVVETKDTAEAEAPPANVEEKKIAVKINTDPEEAVILIEGLGQVCSKAPCDVELTEGQPVQIEAKLGKRNAKMTFTPSEQNRELTLALEKTERRGGRKPRGTGRTGTKKGPGPTKTKTDSSGLKIPGIFKDN